ncbi:MAG: VTT domain-containing protein [Candidatus Hydrothermales bacterium]
MFKLSKRLYDWVLSWAYKKEGALALCFFSSIESIFFPVPPDPLLMALSLGNRERSLYFALLCSVCSVLGGLIGYIIGFYFWELTKDFFFAYVFSVSAFERVSDLYHKNSFFAIFTAGFTPIPYKVFTISAGVFKINVIIFLLASLISRSSRFFIIALLIKIFGEKIKKFIDKYFNLLTIVFMILLIGGFVILKNV